MEHYIEVALESRGHDPARFKGCKCEYCEYKRFHFPEFARTYVLFATIPNYQDVHHIEGRGGKRDKEGLTNDPRNLILLCRKCHQEAVAGHLQKNLMKNIVLFKLFLNGHYEDKQGERPLNNSYITYFRPF
jgi:hypothetical protein